MAFEHPSIKNGAIDERAYQVNIAQISQQVSTLVVLPTGMGKTIIALLVMVKVKEREPDGKILFLAPTKPLVNQHARDIEDMLDLGGTVVFTGEVKPKDRERLWKESDVVVSTPQVIRNDLMSQRINLDDVSLVVFDEAHRGVGNYAYVYIGEVYKKQKGLRLGLTASPGSDIDTIISVCEELGFENVEIRTKYDPDVVDYVHKRDIEWVNVRLSPKQKKIVNLLQDVRKTYIKKLQNMGILVGKNPKRIPKKDILSANKRIHAELRTGGKRSLYHAASLVASCLKLDHAIDLAQTQSPNALREFLNKLQNEADSRGGTKAASRIMNQSEIKEASFILDKMDDEHPKVKKAAEVVEEQFKKKKDSRAIVFTSYRHTARKMNLELAKVHGVRPVRFVGQANKKDDKGLKQSQQIEVIKDFEEGKYNVMVATSVGEEGLDIPATDLVVFYEPVPSEIRSIQRRGRTARIRKGRVVILITKNTRDEAYYWSSYSKEKKMWRNLKNMKEELKGKVKVDVSMTDEEFKVVKKKSKKELKNQIKSEDNKDQRSLNDFKVKNNTLEITVDVREQNSMVVKELARNGIKILSTRLTSGDYIISEDMAVERKSVHDFLESLMNGRLFSQAKMLTRDYPNPVMIIEGDSLHGKRNINERAIYGALASLVADFRMTIFRAEDGRETAGILIALSKRGNKGKKTKSVRKDKQSLSTADTKRYILEGLPNVSGTLADRLLEHFGSVRAVFLADEESLREVKGIGPATAKKILEILD
ncbi:MAG: DEAD/DEAH box helicase [Thermoplasmata archaeon]